MRRLQVAGKKDRPRPGLFAVLEGSPGPLHRLASQAVTEEEMSIRFTSEEFQRLQDPMNVRARKALDSVATASRRNKYGAKATSVDGRRFDSKAEAKRYLQLKAMQQAGEISGLELQVEFELIPALDIAGRKEKPVRYVADFRYQKGGETIVEDTKSAPTKTKEYIIKRKLLLLRYGIAIREVLIDC